MKTRKVRLALPFVAFMLAIVAAFATVPEPDNETALVQGYILQNGTCHAAIMCSDQGEVRCSSNGKWANKFTSPTVCDQPLFFPPL